MSSPTHLKRLVATVATAAAVIALAVAAAPASASEPIDSFNTTTSDTSAGGHPDFTTSFTLHNPGAPEAAQNVIFNAPEGALRQPLRDHPLHLLGFRPRPVPLQLPGRAGHRL